MAGNLKSRGRCRLTHLRSNGGNGQIGGGALDVFVAHHSRSELSLGLGERGSRVAVQTAHPDEEEEVGESHQSEAQSNDQSDYSHSNVPTSCLGAEGTQRNDEATSSHARQTDTLDGRCYQLREEYAEKDHEIE